MSLPSLVPASKKSSSLSRILSISAICLLSLSVSTASAEPSEKKFGRLADGRAYRVDSSGFRLVDQVAELEVTVDELRRELEASRNENKDQARTITRLKSGNSEASDFEVKEKNLIKSAKISKSTQADPPNCNELVSNLYLKVATLESRLQQAKQANVPQQLAQVQCPEPRSVRVESCDYDSEKNPLWSQVQRLQKELMSGPTKESIASQRKSLGEAERSLVELQSKLTEQSNVSSSLKQELSVRNNELEEAQEQLAALSDELSEVQEENEKFRARGALRTARTKRTTAPATKLTVASTPAAKRLQSRFSKQLSNIQSLILRRKDLLDALEKRGGSYQTSPLVTTNGMSLDTLRSGVATLNWSSNSATIEDGLKEIESLLRKDIQNLS